MAAPPSAALSPVAKPRGFQVKTLKRHDFSEAFHMASLRGICKVTLPALLHHHHQRQGLETEATSPSYHPITPLGAHGGGWYGWTKHTLRWSDPLYPPEGITE